MLSPGGGGGGMDADDPERFRRGSPWTPAFLSNASLLTLLSPPPPFLSQSNHPTLATL
ncbi:hypothetical protein B0H14DRAFT_3492874 [Mycena olivaceomarginata]|nr:hypothetical protein B0H14DRAFT_3492874 [Mycena olivaceomarginata]